MEELIRLARGLWRSAGTVDDLSGRVAALLSLCPDGAVVCGLSAALLHRLWVPNLPRDHLLEIIVHRDIPDATVRGRNRRPQLRARRQQLRPDEITMIDGLPVTSEARTWVDLAACLQPADLVAAGDSVLRSPGAGLAELEEMVRRSRHCRGVIRARAALPLLDARSRSRPESHLRFRLVEAGLPKPAVNVAVHDGYGQWLAEPDLSYDDVRLALEYNGLDHAEVSRMRNDITRGVDVSEGGWRTETFGPVQVFQRYDQVVSLVRHLRLERSRAAA